MMKPDELAANEYAQEECYSLLGRPIPGGQTNDDKESAHLAGQAHMIAKTSPETADLQAKLKRCEEIIEAAYLTLDSIASLHIPNADDPSFWKLRNRKKLVEVIVNDTIQARGALAEIAKLRSQDESLEDSLRGDK